MSSAKIASKILRMQVGSTLAVLVICSLVYITNDVILLKQSVEESTKSSVRTVARNLYSPLVFRDQKETEKILESFRADPNILHAYVTDINNVVFAHYGTGEQSPLEKGNEDQSDVSLSNFGDFHLKKLISMDGELTGTLYVKVSSAILIHQLKMYGVTVLLVMLLGTLLSVLFARATSLSISAPITELAQVVKQVTHSGDYATPIESKNKENALEIAVLYEEFGHLLNQIYERDVAISQANEQLEKRVVERTEELQNAQKQLVESGRMSALGSMAGGIAHEINNPLAIISGKAHLLIKELGNPEKNDRVRQLKFAEDIQRTANRISAIIKGLRAFSRDGAQDPFEAVSVTTLMGDVLDLCRTRLFNHEVELKVPPAFPSIPLECRSTQIGQVFMNLIHNSDDAIEGLPEKWVEVSVSEKETTVQFVFTDSGAGIPKEIRDRIMEPFFTTKPVGKGTGLGLSISRGIIESHHGTMVIDEKCPNTRFVVELPKKQAATLPAEVKKAA